MRFVVTYHPPDTHSQSVTVRVEAADTVGALAEAVGRQMPVGASFEIEREPEPTLDCGCPHVTDCVPSDDADVADKFLIS